MVNKARGEVGLAVDGTVLPMRLTLGELASLEERLDAGGLIALAERFEADVFRASDLIALLTAGLRGAGGAVCEDDVAVMAFDGGAVGAANAAADLLHAAFGTKA